MLAIAKPACPRRVEEVCACGGGKVRARSLRAPHGCSITHDKRSSVALLRKNEGEEISFQ